MRFTVETVGLISVLQFFQRQCIPDKRTRLYIETYTASLLRITFLGETKHFHYLKSVTTEEGTTLLPYTALASFISTFPDDTLDIEAKGTICTAHTKEGIHLIHNPAFTTRPLYSQCCKCGIMLNGPEVGRVPYTPQEVPDLTYGDTHGLCRPCAQETLTAWKEKKRLRLTGETPHGYTI